MSTLQRLLGYTKYYWQRLLLSGITATCFGLLSAAPTYMIQFGVDTIIGKRQEQLLLPFIAIILLLFLLKGFFMYLSSYYMDWVGNRIVNDIRRDLFEKIMYFPISFYQEKTTGTLLAHFLSDITLIQSASSTAVRNGARSLVEAIFLFSVAFIQNWQLTLLMLVVGPIIAITIRKMGNLMRISAQHSQQKMGEISSLLQEIFVGIREIKAFNAESSEINRFTRGLQNYFGVIMKNVQVIAITPACTEVIAMSGTALAFYIAIKQVLIGATTPGQLASFFAALLLAYQPLKRLVNTYADVQTGIAAAGRVFAIMDQTFPDYALGTIHLSSFTNAIECKKLSFAYPDKKNIFTSVNLTLKKGESVGLIGQSGSGKSTLCNLLLGFIAPTQGIIAIDTYDMCSLSVASVRNLIGYVSQRPFLFNDTIAANVAYAHPSASMKNIEAACRAAFAHDFIVELPNGYQTIVGENGSLLSGGQKQRLTIARALLKNPPILIFDEATSSLDHHSEEMIRRALEKICQEKTVIIISHRAAFTEHMDRTFTIIDQQIIEIETNKHQRIFSVEKN